MRDYSRVSPRKWTGDTGRALRGHKAEQILWDYLTTCPTSNMLGLFYLPFPIIAHETGLSESEVKAGLLFLAEEGCAFYDHAQELAWIPTMATWQIGGALTPANNQVKGILRELVTYRGHPFARDFVKLYDERYNLGIGPNADAIDLATGASVIRQKTPLQGPSEDLQRAQQAPPKSGSGSGAGSGTGAGGPPSPGQARISEPKCWEAHRWYRLFGLAWKDKYGRDYGGGAADAKSSGALSDTLTQLPESDIIAAQARAPAMFMEFLADEAPRMVSARHPWPFFVTAFNGLRVDRGRAASHDGRRPPKELPYA